MNSILKSLTMTRNGQIVQLAKRSVHVSRFCLASKEFEQAKGKLSLLKEEPDNLVKLKLYALFKQATVGPCNAPKPGMVDFVGRAKWSAWNELGKMTQSDAEKSYIGLINGLLKEQNVSADSNNQTSSSSSSSSSKYETILTTIEHGNIYKITLNRPEKLNAISIKMYEEIGQALEEADKDPNVLMCVMTGAGRYYCSGNDLSAFATPEAMKDIKKAAADGGVILEKFVNSFVNFNKPLAAIINGPAVGISVTVLAMFDIIIANEKATFSTPFSKTAQTPEGCSTYTFPLLMGHFKAFEMLLLNKVLTAQEACERNLVTQVLPDAGFQEKSSQLLEQISKFPRETLTLSKRLLRDWQKPTLREVNKREVAELVNRWSSKEFLNNYAKFWNKK